MTKKRSFLYYNYFSKQKHIHTIWIRFDSKLETYKNLRMAGANAVALNAITAATSTDKRNENFAMVGWYVRIIFNYLVSMVADGSVRDGDERWWDAALLMCAAVVEERKSFSALFFLHMIFALMGGCRCMMRRRTQRQSGSSNTTSVNNAICVSRCIIFTQNERQRTDSNYDSLDSTRNSFQVGQCSKFLATLSLSLSLIICIHQE